MPQIARTTSTPLLAYPGSIEGPLQGVQVLPGNLIDAISVNAIIGSLNNLNNHYHGFQDLVGVSFGIDNTYATTPGTINDNVSSTPVDGTVYNTPPPFPPLNVVLGGPVLASTQDTLQGVCAYYVGGHSHVVQDTVS